MDSICEKHSITSPQGRNLLLKKLLYEEGYRFIVKYELLGEVCLCIDFPPLRQPFVEIEELKDLDNVCLVEKDGELFVVKGEKHG